MDPSADPEGPRALRLRRLVRLAGLPGIITGALSLILVIGMLANLTLRLQPELDDLRIAQRTMRDAHDAMLDQETGVRGYLAGDDASFLEAYNLGHAASADLERKLVSSLREHPDLVERALDVIAAQHAWQTMWAVPAATSDGQAASTTRLVRPASPITYAVPPGRWSARNCAVARAAVQIDCSGTSKPIRASRACRSRGV